MGGVFTGGVFMRTGAVPSVQPAPKVGPGAGVPLEQQPKGVAAQLTALGAGVGGRPVQPCPFSGPVAGNPLGQQPNFVVAQLTAFGVGGLVVGGMVLACLLGQPSPYQPLALEPSGQQPYWLFAQPPTHYYSVIDLAFHSVFTALSMGR